MYVSRMLAAKFPTVFERSGVDERVSAEIAAHIADICTFLTSSANLFTAEYE